MVLWKHRLSLDFGWALSDQFVEEAADFKYALKDVTMVTSAALNLEEAADFKYPNDYGAMNVVEIIICNMLNIFTCIMTHLWKVRKVVRVWATRRPPPLRRLGPGAHAPPRQAPRREAVRDPHPAPRRRQPGGLCVYHVCEMMKRYGQGALPNGQKSELLESLGRMRSTLCRPYVFAYIGMIKVMVGDGDLDGCLSVWEEMGKDGVQGDGMANTTLVTTLCKGKMVDKGVELFWGMRNKGFLIDRCGQVKCGPTYKR